VRKRLRHGGRRASQRQRSVCQHPPREDAPMCYSVKNGKRWIVRHKPYEEFGDDNQVQHTE
jgi:hypothetical protein